MPILTILIVSSTTLQGISQHRGSKIKRQLRTFQLQCVTFQLEYGTIREIHTYLAFNSGMICHKYLIRLWFNLILQPHFIIYGNWWSIDKNQPAWILNTYQSWWLISVLISELVLSLISNYICIWNLESYLLSHALDFRMACHSFPYDLLFISCHMPQTHRQLNK